MSARNTAVIGTGERAQRNRTRRHIAVKGALFLVGLLSGAYIGYALIANDFDASAPWPQEIAVGLAALYLVALAAGTMLLDKSIDELERHRTYKAITIPATAYLVVYPVWFLLWKAELVVEPIHWLLFVGFMVTFIGSAIYYRFR